MRLGGSALRSFVMFAVTVLTLSACGALGGREVDRPLESFSAEELYKRAEFELESEGNSAEAEKEKISTSIPHKISRTAVW